MTAGQYTPMQGKIMDRVIQALARDGMNAEDMTVEADKGTPVISVYEEDFDGVVHFHLSVESLTIGTHEPPVG